LAEELQACIERSKDERREMDKQVAHYLELGAQCSDLIESNLMMFNLRDPQTGPFLNRWWTEIDRHSRRDQLSLNYALLQSGIEWHPLIERPNCVRTHPAFALAPHDMGSGAPAALVEALGRLPIDPYVGEAYANVREDRIAAQQGRSIDVVVCVHNALEDVRRCMESLHRNRRRGQRLILIDDGSDAPTAQYLEDLARDAAWIALHRNERPTGYTQAANRGLATAESEFVILLNSDTEVTDGWAEKLADAVFSMPGAGIVGPMSSAASHQSIPEHRGANRQTAINELPPGLTAEDMNRYCERWSVVGILPRVPLVHGFCFGVTREVIDKIGLFDANSFPNGYGEENDYCFRAADAGFGLVIATHTYVFHAKSKSYTDDLRVLLMQAGSAAFRQRYGRACVERAIKSVEENPMLAALRENARSLYRDRFVVPQRPE
jgi:GT2 family glycosyltransferase